MKHIDIGIVFLLRAGELDE